jgi:arylsulfatase A-like enzyme
MASTQQNILIIFTDQQRADTLSCYNPDGICQTPHLDLLAAQSTVFHNAYTVCTVCSPARASLQTGVYPHAHGVEANVYGRGCLVHELPDSESLLSRRLLQAGYSAGYTGKWHLGEGGAAGMPDAGGLRAAMAPKASGLPTDLGYEGDDFPGHGGGGYAYPLYKEYLQKNGLSFDVAGRDNYGGGHTTTGEVTSPLESTNEYFLVNQAIHFIGQFRLRNRPFCFQLHFWGPHEPFFAPTQFLDLYRDRPIPPWPNFNEDRSQKPNYHNRFRRADEPWEFWENALRYYYGFMSSIDAQIGRLIDYLKACDLYDNTAIIFSTDHGDSQGCHGGIENKSYHMYQETVRIPLFIKPASPDCKRCDVDAFVNTCDLYSSILDLAGLPAELIRAGHGRSLLPFVQDKEPRGWRQSIVCEGLTATGIQCSHRMIRHGNWKYVFYASGTDELYNLQEDPWEITNLINEPAYAHNRTQLQHLLHQWMADHGDPIRSDYERLRPESIQENVS